MLNWKETKKNNKKVISPSPSQEPLYLQLPTVLIYNRETTGISGETTLLAGFLTPFFTLSTVPFSWFLARGTLTRGTKRMLLSLRWRCCHHGSAFTWGDGLAALEFDQRLTSDSFILTTRNTSVGFYDNIVGINEKWGQSLGNGIATEWYPSSSVHLWKHLKRELWHFLSKLQ